MPTYWHTKCCIIFALEKMQKPDTRWLLHTIATFKCLMRYILQQQNVYVQWWHITTLFFDCNICCSDFIAPQFIHPFVVSQNFTCKFIIRYWMAYSFCFKYILYLPYLCICNYNALIINNAWFLERSFIAESNMNIFMEEKKLVARKIET